MVDASKSKMPMCSNVKRNRTELEKQFPREREREREREWEMRILMMLLSFDPGRSFAKPSLPLPFETSNRSFPFPASFKLQFQHPNSSFASSKSIYIFRNIMKWYKHLCLESNKNKHVSSYLIVWNKFRIQSIAQNRMFWCYWYSFECRVRNKVWDGVYSL